MQKVILLVLHVCLMIIITIKYYLIMINFVMIIIKVIQTK